MSIIDLAVAQDHLESIAKVRKPILAIEELIWNALDADATHVEVKFAKNGLGELEHISVLDNGTGLAFEDSEDAFGTLGGSPKLRHQKTPAGRQLHGKEGRGRFRAFGLGDTIDWHSCYRKDGKLIEFTISGNRANLSKFPISVPAHSSEQSTGVQVEISNIEDKLNSLLTESSYRELLSRIALYLKSYPGIEIIYNGENVDPVSVQNKVDTYTYSITTKTGEEISAELTVIEWNVSVQRALYLCNDDGFAREELSPGIHAKGFDFSAYLKSSIFGTINEADIMLWELKPEIKALVDQAKDILRDHFRRREAELTKSLVDKWKEEEIYPYLGETASPLEKIEREVFDICALKVHEFLPGFEDSKPTSKKLTFRLIKQALETNPSSLQMILQEVVSLPSEQQNELAELLRKTRLSAIINAAKMVADRLTFLVALEEMLYSESLKPRIEERSQLHRILVNELWIFGEQYLLGIDDESLKSLLSKHISFLEREELSPNVEVKDIYDRNGILDLMLYRRFPIGEPDRYEHLVIELKRPTCPIGHKEISQIERYAFTIANDERFDKATTKWNFLLIGNRLDDFAKAKSAETGKVFGHIHSSDSVNIYLKEWSSIIQQAKWRYEFFRNKLEYEATAGDATAYLNKKYSEFLPRE